MLARVFGGGGVKAPLDNYIQRFILLGYNYTDIGEKCGVNIGDHIQTIAVSKIIKNLYPDIEYVFWDRDNLTNYNGGNAFTILQGWFSFDNCYSFIPNKNILPIFIGTHFTKKTQEKFIRFLEYNPDYLNGKTIGCRDLITKKFFQDIGINAYLSRCLTLTLPKRELLPTQNKIFIVDIPKDWFKYIPKDITKNAIIKNQRSMDMNKNVSHYYKSTSIYIKEAKERLEEYKNEGKLVITSCLHCAAPCVAMGIPTVLIVPDNKDYRYSTLKGILKIYTLDDLKNRQVDFYPHGIDIEDLKCLLIKNVELTIKQEFNEQINIDELNKIRNEIENYSIL